MKIFLIISYLVGGIFLPIPWDEEPLPAAHQAAADRKEHVIEVIDVTVNQQIYLTTINDLSLYDNTADVIRKVGSPEKKATELDLVEYTVFVYPNMSVYFKDELIDYVEISSEVNTLMLDQTEVPATIEGIK